MLKKAKNTSHEDESRTKVSTLIGEGAIFNGDLTSPETVRIDGTVNGNCTCDKKLIVGSEGHIKGNISAQGVIISGKVEGDISVRGKMELLSTGRVIGNITARSLVIDEDAYFDGRCTMTSDGSNSSATVNNLTEALSEFDSNESSKTKPQNK